MVLDKKGKMVTGRKHPRMWLARGNQVMKDFHMFNTLELGILSRRIRILLLTQDP